MGLSKCFYIFFLFIVIFNNVVSISDLRACANEDCTEVLSHAKTLITYHSDNPHTLSFAKDSDAIVYSKSAGSDRSLWGVVINGRRGYAPKKFLKETKKVSKIRFEVPTEYYEVIGDKLVPKEVPASPDKIFSEENTTANSDENNNQNQIHTHNTEELVVEKPAILSDVSGEVINNEKIDASPSYVVIEGTTIHPSVEEVLNSGEVVQDNTHSGDNNYFTTAQPVIKNDDAVVSDDSKPILDTQPIPHSVSPESQHVLEPVVESNATFERDSFSAELQNDGSSEELSDLLEKDVKQESTLREQTASNQEIKPLPLEPVKIDFVENNMDIVNTSKEIDHDIKDKLFDELENKSHGLNNSGKEFIENIENKNSESIEEIIESEENASGVETDSDVDDIDEVVTEFYNLKSSIPEHSGENQPQPQYMNEQNDAVTEESMHLPFNEKSAAEQQLTMNEDHKTVVEEEKIVDEVGIINLIDKSENDSSEVPSNANIVEIDIENKNENTDSEVPIDNVKAEHTSPEQLTTFNYLNPNNPHLVQPPITEQYIPSTVPPVAENEPSKNVANDFLIDPDIQNNYIHPNEDAISNTDQSNLDTTNNEESSFFSFFYSINDYAFNMFKSNDVDQDEVNVEKAEKSLEDVDKKISGWNSFIASFSPEYQALPQCRPEDNIIAMTEVSSDLVLWLVISAVSVLAFTLGYYFLENRKQDGKLLAMVNSLQKELLCSSKECILLKDELTITKEKLIGIEDSSFGSDEMVASLKKEITESQHTISSLLDKLAQTEDELANSTEAALELQAILDEQLSSKDTSNSSLTFTVSNLQSQLDEQQTTMNLTKEQLAAKVEENEILLLKMVEAGKKTSTIEKELAESQNQLLQAREECEHKAQQLHELTTTMENSLQQLQSQKSTDIKNLQSQLKNTKSELESSKILLKARAHEVASLHESLKQLKLDSSNIEALLDVSSTKAELVQVSIEKSAAAEKLEKQESLLTELTNKVELQESQMKEMRDGLNDAEQKAIQATSRLEVLTNYFNQKEAELMKELNTKEDLWLSQQGENMSTVEKIQSLQQEIQQYKETAESVRRELAEQEAAWRARNTALERRAHEQWLARRAAERQANAAASEAQTLRQRLLAPSPTDKPQGMVSPLNSVDGIGEIPFMHPPPLMFPPPTDKPQGMGSPAEDMGPIPFLPPPLPFPPFPPIGGLPPPPFLPHPLHTHRPPPLGRLSSPLHPPMMRNDRYSPDSSPDRERNYSPERRSTPLNRGRSPYTHEGGGRRQYRYYDSSEDRRPHRRYDETETDMSPPPSPPPPRRGGARNHKGISSGSGQSSESLERIISKHSNKY